MAACAAASISTSRSYGPEQARQLGQRVRQAARTSRVASAGRAAQPPGPARAGLRCVRCSSAAAERVGTITAVARAWSTSCSGNRPMSVGETRAASGRGGGDRGSRGAAIAWVHRTGGTSALSSSLRARRAASAPRRRPNWPATHDPSRRWSRRPAARPRPAPPAARRSPSARATEARVGRRHDQTQPAHGRGGPRGQASPAPPRSGPPGA